MSAVSEAATSPLFTPAFREDPVGVLAELRERDPVHELPGLGVWIVTPWRLVRQLFTDPHCTPDRSYHRGWVPPEGEFMRYLSQHGLFSAPPEQHARLRKLVSFAFTPRSVRRMDAQVREVVEQFAAPLRGRTGRLDIVGEFTDAIPNTVISRITGIPAKEDDEQRFRRIAGEALGGINPLADAATQQAAEAALVELAEWVGEMAEERRKHPREDLISDLVAANDIDDYMTNNEIVAMVSALVSAGTETTAIGSMMGLRSLLEHPEEMERLRADPALMPNAVRELLRFDFGHSSMLPRYAMEDFELEGRKIAKGDVLLLSFTGAHRDPTMFEDPDRLDLGRDTRNLTIFGHGPHFCIGANLAQQELGTIYEAALELLPPGTEILRDELDYRDVPPFFHGIANLPVHVPG